MNFYNKLQYEVLKKIPAELNSEKVTISPIESITAIGAPKEKDYVLLKGKEKMLQVNFKGNVGQAFSNELCKTTKTLKEILDLKLDTTLNRAIYIATINAVFRHLGFIDRTAHCKDEKPYECSLKLVDTLYERFGNVKLALIGYQPRFAEKLTKKFEIKITDLDPENWGKNVGNTVIQNGQENSEVLNWCDIALVTGSTIVNGTIEDFLIDKPVIFFGNTISAAAKLLDLNHFCPLSN